WLPVGDLQIDLAFLADPLSITMCLFVTGIGTLIHLYAIGYMHGDPKFSKFFLYLNLFATSMLVLVLGENLLVTFLGWEGVGTCSYLLISFWHTRESAATAGKKAFVTNRVGDWGVLIAMFLAFGAVGSVSYSTINAAATSGNIATTTATAMGAMLFVGAVGKSAQLPLYFWLPDAMEGPTPVSALIHAATMVTAGVFMVCRLSPMFEYAPDALALVTVVGAVTCFFAATVGMVQNDIKRVIAYSTCSQLGYMFFAAGVSAYPAAMFHLLTHAFFKALLFLGAGSVIHGMHHEQDMRKMGGLWKYLPVTYAVMMIGTLAITGVGVPGLDLGFAGFYSKDSIIEVSWAAGRENGIAQFAFVVSLLAAALTAFYSWRLVFMTFHGTRKWGADAAAAHAHDDHATSAQIETHDEPLADDHAHGHDDHGHGHDLHPHESPLTMMVPLAVLSIGAVFAGGVFIAWFVGHDQAAFWAGSVFNSATNHVLHEMHEAPTWVKLAPLVVTITGTLIAWYAYILKEGMGARIAANKGPLWSFLYNKWFFDELYEATFVRGAKLLGDLFWKGGDQKLIDGLGPDGVAAASVAVGKGTGRLQTGYVYHYAFVMLLGIAGLLTYALFQFRG
ncbi:MAG: NADH-quinone oxidoreductase subunit L, partial [Caulobacter sp.]|nr:NADH-quinone oxidoreductase subunit L [Caulobacter sp.]